MPLPKLQRLATGAGTAEDRFLYDYAWPDEVAESRVGAPGFDDTLYLRPGAGEWLVRLAGVLRPIVQQRWATFVADACRCRRCRLPGRFPLRLGPLQPGPGAFAAPRGTGGLVLLLRYGGARLGRSGGPLHPLGPPAGQRAAQPGDRQSRLQQRQEGLARRDRAPRPMAGPLYAWRGRLWPARRDRPGAALAGRPGPEDWDSQRRIPMATGGTLLWDGVGRYAPADTFEIRALLVA